MSTTDPDVRSGTVVVIGIGNRYRSDDAAGLDAVRLIRDAAPAAVAVVEVEGDSTSLLDAWGDAETAYVVDAVSSGSEPGTLYRLDTTVAPAPAPFHHRGSHAFSVVDVIELARALDRLPARLVVYGIEGSEFGFGDGLTPAVQAAVRSTAERLLAELHEDAR